MAKNTEMQVRMLPHNLEAEQALLGSILLDETATISIFSKVKVSNSAVWFAKLSEFKPN